MNEEMQNEKQRFATFYIDESFIKIVGVKHILVGAICSRDENHTVEKVMTLKRTINFGPLDEIKWNMSGAVLSESQRIQVSDDVIHILTTDCEGLIVLLEGENKQRAAELLVVQIEKYCEERSISGYNLFFDQDLLSDEKAFEQYIRNINEGQNKCIGFQSMVSSRNQMLQCSDIFNGVFRTSIDKAVSGKDFEIHVRDEGLDEQIVMNLTDYLRIATRYVLWGDASMPIEEFENGALTYKHAIGMGLIIQSGINESVKAIIDSQVGTVYIGCMH